MSHKMLDKLDESLHKYRSEHLGEKPLYILVSSADMDTLLKDVRERQGFSGNSIITTYKESKIINYSALKQGELQLSNELPDTGS